MNGEYCTHTNKHAVRLFAYSLAHAAHRPVQLLYTKNWRGQEVVVEIEQSDEDEDDDDDQDWPDELDANGLNNGGGGSSSSILPSRADIKRKAATNAAKEQQAAKRAKKVLPSFLKGSRISGSGVVGAEEDDDTAGLGVAVNGDIDDAVDSDEIVSGDVNGGRLGAAEAGVHARRLGAAALNSVEDMDEFKKRLVPMTERMRQVWRRQQQMERRARVEAEGGVDGSGVGNGGNGEEMWWKDEEDDDDDDDDDWVGLAVGKRGMGCRNGKRSSDGGGRVNGVGRGMAAVPGGVRVVVGGRYVPIESLTREDAAKMSSEEYTRFYNLSVGGR